MGEPRAETPAAAPLSRAEPARLLVAFAEWAVSAYFVIVFVVFFSHGDMWMSRSGLMSVRPIPLFFALLSPLLFLVVTGDVGNGLRSVLAVWRRNAGILLPLLALALVGLFAAQLPNANWGEGAKYVIYPFYVLAAVMAAMLLPLLAPVRRSFRLAVWLSLLTLIGTVAADVVSPALFSKLPSRAAGLPSDANAAAALMVVASALLLDWRRQRKSDVLLLALTGAALVATFSRAGFLLYGLLLAVYAVSALGRHERGRSVLRRVLPIALAVLVVIGGFAWVRATAGEGAAGMLGKHRAQRRVAMFTGGESLLSDSDDRRVIAMRYFALIAEAPLLGHGAGFSYAQPKGPHVRLLQEWVNGGLAAALAFVALFVFALTSFARRKARTAVAFILVLITWGLFNHVFMEYRSALLALGMVAAGSLPELRDLLERRRPEER